MNERIRLVVEPICQVSVLPDRSRHLGMGDATGQSYASLGLRGSGNVRWVASSADNRGTSQGNRPFLASGGRGTGGDDGGRKGRDRRSRVAFTTAAAKEATPVKTWERLVLWIPFFVMIVMFLGQWVSQGHL